MKEQNKPKKSASVNHWTNDVKWFTQGSHCFGIVRIHDPFEGHKYYIGIGAGFNEAADFDRIASWGAKFPKQAGDALFTNNDD